MEAFVQRRARAVVLGRFVFCPRFIGDAGCQLYAMDPDYEIKIQPIKFAYGSKEVLGCWK